MADEAGSVNRTFFVDIERVRRRRPNDPVDLRASSVHHLLKGGEGMLPVENLTAMDAPENMDALCRIGRAAGEKFVEATHVPAAFDAELTK